MGDVSLVQMLLWNKGVFRTESKGFPCLSFLEFCLGLDTWQASASVICQTIYLGMSGTTSDVTISPQAKALFGLNVSISIIGVVMGLIMLNVNLMKTVKRKVVTITFSAWTGSWSQHRFRCGIYNLYID